MKYKYYKIFAGALIVSLAGLLSSCEKTFDDKTPGQTDFSNDAFVQVYNTMTNSARTYVYVNGSQVTGALLTPGTLFPSSANSFRVKSGLNAFLVRDTATVTTQVPLSFAAQFEAKKNYTVFVYDTITAPKQKTVFTDIVIPSDTSFRLRFANFVYSPTALPAVDVFSFARNANVFTNVNTTDVTGFIPYPSLLVTDTLYVRETGTSNLLLKLTITGGYLPKRNLTLLYRGSQLAGTRTITSFYNY